MSNLEEGSPENLTEMSFMRAAAYSELKKHQSILRVKKSLYEENPVPKSACVPKSPNFSPVLEYYSRMSNFLNQMIARINTTMPSSKSTPVEEAEIGSFMSSDVVLGDLSLKELLSYYSRILKEAKTTSQSDRLELARHLSALKEDFKEKPLYSVLRGQGILLENSIRNTNLRSKMASEYQRLHLLQLAKQIYLPMVVLHRLDEPRKQRAIQGIWEQWSLELVKYLLVCVPEAVSHLNRTDPPLKDLMRLSRELTHIGGSPNPEGLGLPRDPVNT